MDMNASMNPAVIYTRPDDLRFQDSYRKWQGIPSIEVTERGKVFICFFGGEAAEQGGNFLVVCVSEDGGETFCSCEMIVEHPDPTCRIYDASIWIDPAKRLWVCWAQTQGFYDGRNGVWCSVCDEPDAKLPVWSPPRRIAHGIMLNKPLVTSGGDWLFPCALWRKECGSIPAGHSELDDNRFSNVYASVDGGKSFSLRGCADVPMRSFDEHMIVEKRDGTLWMLVRTFEGIGESFSADGGYTWTPGRKSHIDGPCSRFHIRRLKSGRLLLLNHNGFEQRIDFDDIMHQGNVKSWKGRSHLTALLSDDDGATWPYSLLLDVRNEAAYPDAAECPDGYIYITYDYERVTHREIYLARITEDDILKGRVESPRGILRRVINKAVG